MAENPENPSIDDENQDDFQEQERNRILSEEIDPIQLVEYLYHIWWTWADFEITLISPVFSRYEPPRVIPPEMTEEGDTVEFVYPIHDAGYKFSTSKADNMFDAGMSMYKMYLTIEKIIFLVVERLKREGVDGETEVRVAFGGHELCQRKAFESIINLNYNLVVTNYDPGAWGENYLEVVKRLADKGYGYPSEAPRETFRHSVRSDHKPKQS